MAEKKLTLAEFLKRRPFLGVLFRGKTSAERTNVLRGMGIEVVSAALSSGVAQIIAEVVRVRLKELLKVAR